MKKTSLQIIKAIFLFFVLFSFGQSRFAEEKKSTANAKQTTKQSAKNDKQSDKKNNKTADKKTAKPAESDIKKITETKDENAAKPAVEAEAAENAGKAAEEKKVAEEKKEEGTADKKTDKQAEKNADKTADKNANKNAKNDGKKEAKKEDKKDATTAKKDDKSGKGVKKDDKKNEKKSDGKEPVVALLPAGKNADNLQNAAQGATVSNAEEYAAQLLGAGDGAPTPVVVQGSSSARKPSLKSDKNLAAAEVKNQTKTPVAPLPQAPVNPNQWIGYKQVEALATNGNPELALKQLNMRLMNSPDDGKAAYIKGLILMQLGRADEAERWFKMMQVNFPSQSAASNALAVIYQGRGDWNAARATLEGFLEREPDNINARKNLAYIYTKLAREQYYRATQTKKDPAVEAKIHALDDLL
ncbi:MAG: tetratricopeptide repeat protein [Cardiobacteriaceae bacterium]|nr:tetratricopeptide repeat protein [Cardiobacteriaceae bacterium]